MSEVELDVPGATAATSVAMDRTRGPWAGGMAGGLVCWDVHGTPGALDAINHDGHPCASAWLGLCVVVRWESEPRPPPTWPTITIEVGTIPKSDGSTRF